METAVINCTVSHAVARIQMNRPQCHNAFNAELIRALHACFVNVQSRQDVRVVVLSGAGRHFSAGADVHWMRAAGEADESENEADALRLAEMLHALHSLPQPTIAQIHGAAIGGGMGLVCACDMAVATEDAVFATSEVRLGLAPSTISPYVLSAIGPRQAARYFLTGERMSASEARQLGVVHAVCAPADVDAVVAGWIEALLKGGIQAQAASKALIDMVAHQPITEALRQKTAKHIAHLRGQEEAKQGLSAFLNKQPAPWCPTEY